MGTLFERTCETEMSPTKLITTEMENESNISKFFKKQQFDVGGGKLSSTTRHSPKGPKYKDFGILRRSLMGNQDHFEDFLNLKKNRER